MRLAFCIPTLNRGGTIGATLESIIAQANDDVEIVIVDGASADETAHVVESYRSRFGRIRYLVRPENMGVDRDMDKSVELAEADYCWLMSSDDTLKPGAVDRVLEVLRSEPSLDIVNSEVRDESLSRVIEPKNGFFNITEGEWIQPSEDEVIFVRAANYLAYMGAVVINRSLWMARNRARYYGSEFIHMGVIFQEPLPGATFLLAEPLIIMRYGNATWSSRAFEIAAFKWPHLIWSFPGFSDEAKAQVTPKQAWRKPMTLMYHRAVGSYSAREYVKYIRPLPASLAQKALATAIALLPGALANALSLTYHCTIRRSATARYNLRHSRSYAPRIVNSLRAGIRKSLAA